MDPFWSVYNIFSVRPGSIRYRENMTHSDIKNEIKRLGIAERILLVEEIWDSIVEDQEHVPITEAQREELGRRIEHYEKSPEEGASWEQIKNRIKNEK